MKFADVEKFRASLEKADSDEIASDFSDFHKDVHGFRPRHVHLYSKNPKFDREYLINEYVALIEYMNEMFSSESGRDYLRSQGWQIDYEVGDRLDYNDRAYDVSVVHSELNERGEFVVIAYTLTPIARIDIPTIVVKASEIRRYEREMLDRQRAAEFGVTYEEYIR